MISAQHDFFSEVFGELNSKHSRPIVELDGDKVVPLDDRTRFIFDNVLTGKTVSDTAKGKSYSFAYEPTDGFKSIGDGRLAKLRREAFNQTQAGAFFIQTE